MQAQSEILSAFDTLRKADPTIRAVDAAAQLAISEGALLEIRCAGGEVERLALRSASCLALIEGLKSVGPVMTLTRNAAAVHETKGPVQNVSAHGAMGQVTGEIDLRLFMARWHVVYHVTEPTKSGTRQSFQIVDIHGIPVLKVFAMDETDLDKWSDLRRSHADKSEAITTYAPPASAPAERPDSEVDVVELRRQWQELDHSHEFFGMLRALQVGREQALRLAGQDLAVRIDANRLEALLQDAATQQIPIMCFVGNPGSIQIFSGPISRIAMMGPWLNVLDARFNLHLRTDMVENAWVVRKPTASRGMITSVELFDDTGEMVCQFFGVRAPGGTERPDWRALAETLCEGETT